MHFFLSTKVIKMPAKTYLGTVLMVLMGLAVFLFAYQVEAFEGGSPTAEKRCKYLEDMVRYLTVIVQKHAAQREVYKLTNGYAQTFGSPRLDALERKRQYLLSQVKKDPQEIAFFRENLTIML